MTSNEVATQLAELGIARGSVLVVHTAFIHWADLHFQDDELVFLHPRGACAECDDARGAVPTSAGRS